MPYRWIDGDGTSHAPTFEAQIDQAALAAKHGSHSHNGIERPNVTPHEPPPEVSPEDQFTMMSDAIGAVFRFCWDQGMDKKLKWSRVAMRFAAITLAIRPDLLPRGTTANTVAKHFKVSKPAVSYILTRFGREVGLHLNRRLRGSCLRMRDAKLQRRTQDPAPVARK